MKTYTGKSKIGKRALCSTVSWFGPCQSMESALAKDTAEPVSDKLFVIDTDVAACGKLAEMRPASEVGSTSIATLAKWTSESA